jgi:hypothetical protein
MVAENFTVHTKCFTANAAIELQFHRLVLIALTELLGLLAYLHSLMFGRKFRGMVVLIALHAKMSILGNAI